MPVELVMGILASDSIISVFRRIEEIWKGGMASRARHNY